MRTIYSFVVVAVLSAGDLARAQAVPAPSLVITTATVDTGGDTITIEGANFGNRPLVTLDLIPLDVRLVIASRMVVGAPAQAIPAGTYLLTVSRGPLAGDSASVTVSLGRPAASSPASTPPGPSGPPSVTPAPDASDTAATLGDRVVTVAEVDREWQRSDPAGYLAVMRQLYETRRRVASTIVSDALLTREAEARGITVDALLKEELPKRTITMPDAAVTSLYLSLGDRTRGASLDQMRPALRAWLARNTEPELAKMNYIEELSKTSVRADVLLTAPRVAVTVTSGDPMLGAAAAPVQIVAFGDVQSTEYVRFAETFGRVRDTFGDRVQIVFKPLPTFGDASVKVAEAAACAHTQGRFWVFHDAAIKPGSLEVTRLKNLAAETGLDRQRFDACLDGGEFAALPQQAIDEAARYGVSVSPAFLVNGRMAPEAPPFLPPFDYFKRLIEEELQRQTREAVKQPR